MTHTCCCCCSVTQSCQTLFHLVDRSPPGSSAHGMLQAGTLERASISSSRPGDHIYGSTAPALTGRCFPLVLPRKPDPNLALSHTCLVLYEFLWTLEQMWVGGAHPPSAFSSFGSLLVPLPHKDRDVGKRGLSQER